LYNFLPERFLKHLKENRFKDQKGVYLLLYSIIRRYKPEILVETGVAKGVSSAFILCGMHENDKGHLYSIDLPPWEVYSKKEGDIYVLKDGQRHGITEKYPVGDFVPEYLKGRWTLIFGDAKKELPKLLNEIGQISIFMHDSLHTYEHMMFEYEAVWPYIEEGGLLISHDVLWTKAFGDSSKKMGRK
jgi:predicted O-methyltransferase YrrM